MLFLSFFAFLFGLAIGSFLNATLWRMYAGRSFIKGRSECPHCGHVLSWYELVPLVSFLVQGGRCRACAGRIAWQYPLVELITALLFVVAVFVFPGASPWLWGYLWVLLSTLIFIFVYDMRHYIIPDSVLLIAGGATLLAELFGVWRAGSFAAHVGAGVLLATPFLLIVLFSRGRWMGMGDVNYFF